MRKLIFVLMFALIFGVSSAALAGDGSSQKGTPGLKQYNVPFTFQNKNVSGWAYDWDGEYLPQYPEYLQAARFLAPSAFQRKLNTLVVLTTAQTTSEDDAISSIVTVDGQPIYPDPEAWSYFESKNQLWETRSRVWFLPNDPKAKVVIKPTYVELWLASVLGYGQIALTSVVAQSFL